MRKLAAVELALFASSLVASHGTLADEPPMLGTVTVNATYSLQTASVNYGYYWPGVLNVSAPPTNVGTYIGPTPTTVVHAMNCAKAYGKKAPLSGLGPRSGWKTFVISATIWRDSAGTHYESPTGTPPYPGLTMLGGSTQGTQSLVSLPGNSSTAYKIRAFAHEWAHQWGASEATASAVGDDAMNSYAADQGQKCGGL